MHHKKSQSEAAIPLSKDEQQALSLFRQLTTAKQKLVLAAAKK